MAGKQRRRCLTERARLDMHADAGHPTGIVGIEIENDRAAAQRRALIHPVARIGIRQIFGRRDRQRQYVAIIER
jgi:hypothetical protein